MTSVLSLPAVTTSRVPDTQKSPHHRSLSPIGSLRSSGTIRSPRQRQLSISTIFSRSSTYGSIIRHFADRRLSQTASTIVAERSASPSLQSLDSQTSQAHITTQSAVSDSAFEVAGGYGQDSSNASQDQSGSELNDTDQTISIYGRDGDSEVDVWHETAQSSESIEHLNSSAESTESPEQSGHFQSEAFRRWVSTLRRRAAVGDSSHTPSVRHTPRPIVQQACPPSEGHRRSGSHVSSLAFVTGLRSTSMTITNMSLSSIRAPSAVSPRSVVYIRSNPTSRVDLRRSVDSNVVSLTPVLDEAATRRSQKRARKI